MNTAERQTRTHLMSLFERQGFHPRGDLGQNFLIDLNIVEFVAREAEIGPNDVVFEVGTGTGSLTSFLARDAAAVVSVEYDRNVFAMAQDFIGALSNVTLVNADALRNKNHLNPDVLAVVEQRLTEQPGRRLKLVANLPYNVATPVISNIVATDLPWDCMVVTIQLDLALRMTAKPQQGGNFGALSAWLQSQCHVKLIKKLNPQVFWPRPQVESAILCILPAAECRALINDRAFFHEFLRDVFTQRRKVLRGALHSFYGDHLDRDTIDATLTELGLRSDARAEKLDVATLVMLSNRLRKLVGVKSKSFETGSH
jgi:16S rRNA (adenine1518-N6/adenine1519-N6)-dimethyltransferase